MKRLLNILVFFCLFLPALAQEETRIVDSLLYVLPAQEGRERVLTMIELTWEFYDISFDDCIDWGEKAIKEAQQLGFADLEADATYALGMQYSFHGDLDLAQEKLKVAFVLHNALGYEAKAFEDLWNQARYEQEFGSVDSAFSIYKAVLDYAEKRHDSLAIAQVYSNMAVIQYQKLDFVSAETNYKNCLDIFRSIGDTLMVIRIIAYIATVDMESGKASEARSLFLNVIPQLEEIGDYGTLMSIYKNYGQFFEKHIIDLDSARFYFEKAYSIGEFLAANGMIVPVSNKVDLLVEMGNNDYNMGDFDNAVDKYLEAFELAEEASYASGQMLACIGLGTVYSYLSMPSKSLYYLNRFFELESSSGITIAHSSMKFPLILSYARLGKYSELEFELSAFEDEYKGILRENADIYSQLQNLQDDAAGLLQQYESQNKQIQTLQIQCNHYRLAFFGVLTLVIAALFFLLVRKIVRKNVSKNENT